MKVSSPEQTAKLKVAFAKAEETGNYRGVIRILRYGLQTEFVNDDGKNSTFVKRTMPKAKVADSNMPVTYVKDESEKGMAVYGFETVTAEGIPIKEGRWNLIGRIPAPPPPNPEGGGSGKTEETTVSDTDFNELLDVLPQHEASEFRENLKNGYSISKEKEGQKKKDLEDSSLYSDALYDRNGSHGDSLRFVNKNNPKQDTMLHRYDIDKRPEKKPLFKKGSN
jgi:hypothetical protein